MSSTPQITTSRRGIIASALGVCTLIALPKKSHALAQTESNQIMKIDLSSPEAYIKSCRRGGRWMEPLHAWAQRRMLPGRLLPHL